VLLFCVLIYVIPLWRDLLEKLLYWRTNSPLLWMPKVHYRVKRARHYTLTWTSWIQDTPSFFNTLFNITFPYIPTSRERYIYSLEIFRTKHSMYFSLNCACYMFHLSYPLYLIILVTLGEECKLWSSLCHFLHSPVTYIQIFTSAPSSQTPSIYVLPVELQIIFTPV
jgi:hypothetical protein